MKTHIRLFLIFFVLLLPLVVFAGTREKNLRRSRRAEPPNPYRLVDIEEYQKQRMAELSSAARQTDLFESGYTDPCIVMMFLRGNYCNSSFEMQKKLWKWREEWRLDDRNEFCALGMKGKIVWKYPKKEVEAELEKGTRPQHLYKVVYFGDWTEEDQRKLEKKLYEAERKYLRQLKIEERHARQQVKQWLAEWAQKEKELLEEFKEEAYAKWLDDRKDEMWNLKTRAGEGVGDPRYKDITPFGRERLYFLHSKLVGGTYVPTPPLNWPRLSID